MLETLEPQPNLKARVVSHWDTETCGTRYSNQQDRRTYFQELADARYRLEPYIKPLADFPSARGKRVLEIGVGAGSDFQNWFPHADHVTGIDLTSSAVALTEERLKLAGIPEEKYSLQVMDAENLAFEPNSFDIIFSYGVLHHSPDTPKAFSEVYRCLKPGGAFRGMIYHLHSWTALMLYLQHGALKGKPARGLRDILFHHLESPGTKAYTISETYRLLEDVGFSELQLWSQLGPGDLLTIQPSQKYQGALFRIIWKTYPRWLVRRLGNRFGLGLMIRATKPLAALQA